MYEVRQNLVTVAELAKFQRLRPTQISTAYLQGLLAFVSGLPFC